jgi:branched-subunit amino acid transport protein
MADKVQLGDVFLRLLRFSPTSVITVMRNNHFIVEATLYQGGPGLPTFTEGNAL